ncbi:hypothetical protein [Cellvibrio mixtus]|uniref:hypothetical protein n=1 Tax=Cellvibrio mixtus TaxID=39650 RepID=UPI0005869DF3|nr:hypothetical protein [Cellvibrio mixtus]
MKTTYRYLLTTLLSLGALIALMWLSTWQSISLQKVEVAYNGNDYEAITLPFAQDHLGGYSIRVTIDGIRSNKHSFRIYPDDEIHALIVNGKPVSLDHLSTDDRRNYGSGFTIEIDQFIPNQTNVLEAQLSNASNPAGFRIESIKRLSNSKLLAIYAVLVALVFVLKRHLQINKTQTLVLLIGLVISTLYLSKTDERTRTFDVFEGGGHKDYIEYLIEHKKLPIPGDGWEYHQPPLYYLSAALAKQTAPIDSKVSGELWGQLFAMFLWVLFLIGSLATIRLAFRKHPLVITMASIALCLWPSGIIHSIRIGNDLGVYACYALSFFYTIKWWKNRDSQTLFWASLWMAGSLLSKSNGLAVAGVLGVLMLFHIYGLARKPALFQQHKTKLFRDVAIAGGLFCGAILLNFADNIKHYLDGTSEDWLLSNVSEMINPGLKVGNEPKNYLILDTATFLEQPFISTWEDKYGRQYFWNFVLRSALSSEYFFNGDGMQIWGTVNGILLLAMLAGTAVFYLQQQPQTGAARFKRLAYRNAPWIMALVFPFILLLAYRIKVPLSCNTDFRYIYPVLLPILFFVFQAWSSSSRLMIARVMTLAAPVIGLNSLLWIYLLLQQ